MLTAIETAPSKASGRRAFQSTVIAASAMWSFHQADIDLQVIAIEFAGIAEMPILLAIPLFILAGNLLGILVAIASDQNLPIRFIGVGEQAEDLDVFSAREFVAALLRPTAGNAES